MGNVFQQTDTEHQRGQGCLFIHKIKAGVDPLHRTCVCTLRCAGVDDVWLFNLVSSSAHLQLDLDPYLDHYTMVKKEKGH